jgi:4-amino-4-deoxy-L-arabinose transferase-like glycosyltransferase
MDLIFLAAILLVTRIAFRSHYLYDIDSVNFALGLRYFNPGIYQPHPPGYFLYIVLGRGVNALFPDVNAALVAVSIGASLGALIMIYLLADNWFGRRPALFSGLIFVFSPLAWFHGTVALTYVLEAFFSALLGYLCWRVFTGKGAMIVPAAVTLGVATGFRPSTILFLTPLLLFSLIFQRGGARSRDAIAGAVALLATLAAWFLPMISESGGFGPYWSSLASLWRMVPAKQTVFNSSPVNSLARLFSIAGIYMLCFGCASILAFRNRRGEALVDRRKMIFIRVWLGPGLLFFIFVFLKFVNSGYLLLLSPPVFALSGLQLSKWYEGLRINRPARIAFIGLFAMVNTAIFVAAPVYCSWTSVHRFETELENAVRAIPQIASPGDTMIVGVDSHFLGYRHAGYYLPNWFTVQYPQVRLDSGTRVFAMEHGTTRLLEKIPASRFKYFIVFPLPPNDSEYNEYMAHVRAKFPKSALRTVVAGGDEFTIGVVADLPLLFPAAAR